MLSSCARMSVVYCHVPVRCSWCYAEHCFASINEITISRWPMRAASINAVIPSLSPALTLWIMPRILWKRGRRQPHHRGVGLLYDEWNIYTVNRLHGEQPNYSHWQVKCHRHSRRPRKPAKNHRRRFEPLVQSRERRRVGGEKFKLDGGGCERHE